MKYLIHNIAELIGLIVAIIYYGNIKVSHMKWFLPFLMTIFLGEIFAEYEYFILNKSNVIVHYIIGIIESIFYGYTFYNLYQRRSLKVAIVWFVFLSVSVYIFGLFFYTSDYSYFLPSLIASGFFLAVISVGYIYVKYVDDDESILFTESGFWIALGVSSFFSGTSIVFCLHDFIVKNDLTLFGIRLYNIVPQILCFVLYASISIAIILCKKKTKALS